MKMHIYREAFISDSALVCLTIGLTIAVLSCNNKGEKLWVN